MNIILDLFLTFAKIGLFTFGGGYAMISLIENACVEKKQWITHDEMMDVTVIAESTPGPIAINCATFVGYKQKGLIGAIASTIGVVLPSFCIIFVISMLLDNFLEIAVDASHIPYIFTANDLEPISAPLLDRMEVIRMESPALDTIRNITKEFTLPQALAAYGSDQVEFGDHELDMLVDLLWAQGGRSCRVYQKAVEMLVSDACLAGMENNRKVQITEEGIRSAAAMCSRGRSTKQLGFGT